MANISRKAGCGRAALRWAAVAVLGLGLGGCGPAYDDGFWRDSGFFQGNSDSGEAMAALSKGDWTRAESLATDAMRRNPKDPYALLVLATVYQNTGRTELARQYYTSLLSLHPQEVALEGTGPGAQRKTIEQIARDALQTLPVQGAALADPRFPGARVVAPPPPGQGLTDPALALDNNLILRFQALRQLLDDNQITREEYDQRRGANLGALMRYSLKRPAAVGLDRDAPLPEQVSRRLKALAQAVQDGQLDANAQTVERQAILDSLLPATPSQRADLADPVTNDMQLAAALGRVERFRQANVLTGAEATRESGAVRQQYLAYQAEAELAARAAAGMPVPVATPAGYGVQLGAFRSEAQANSAWSRLQSRFPELSGLQPVVRHVSARRKGGLWRLSAGPVSDRAEALSLCRGLKRARAACSPTVL